MLIPGGIGCVNVGDATRTVNGVFQLFSNHNRIISAFQGMGYCVLPDIIWRKPSNSPNARLRAHQRFINALSQEQREKCYQNENYPFLVKTRQEVKAYFPLISHIRPAENGAECRYRQPGE